jgi:citrate synthase
MSAATVGGLDGVIACDSAITLVDGEKGELFFRGYPVAELAEQADYLAVLYLLWHSQWPTSAEQAAFDHEVRARREVPAEAQTLLHLLSQRQARPMAALRTVVSLLGALEEAEDPLISALTLVARMPGLVASLARLTSGLTSVAPNPDLGHAANYLYMLHGSPPMPEEAEALNALLILHMEHELNASTFAARTVIGTGSDYFSAIAAAIGALKGPRHGGAIDAVVPMLREIGSPEAVPSYVERALCQHRKLPGFGHRVYRHRDPRAAIQARIAERHRDAALVRTARRLEQEMLDRKGLPANVDYYAAIGLDALGLPNELFTSFIASARVAGWTAHILEQLTNNRLIRPRALYTGPRGRTLEGARPL